MKNLTSLALASLVTTSLLAGCITGDVEPAGESLDDTTTKPESEPEPEPEPEPQPDPEPTFLPTSCAEIAAHDPAAKDGDYTLYIGGDESKPWTAYCHDLANGGLEFLSLPGGSVESSSSYAAGDHASGTTVTTTYRKVRIDPETLEVDIGDQTFAISTGQVTHPGGITVTSMPFGVAMSCSSTRTGVATIYLEGTSMALADTFVMFGFAPHGTPIHGPKLTRLWGGGECGWFGPASAVANPFNQTKGMTLKLTYAP